MKIFKVILTRMSQTDPGIGNPELEEFEIFISAENLLEAVSGLHSSKKISFLEVKGIAMAAELTVL